MLESILSHYKIQNSILEKDGISILTFHFNFTLAWIFWVFYCFGNLGQTSWFQDFLPKIVTYDLSLGC